MTEYTCHAIGSIMEQRTASEHKRNVPDADIRPIIQETFFNKNSHYAACGLKNMKTQEIISIKLERDPLRTKRQYRPDLTVFFSIPPNFKWSVPWHLQYQLAQHHCVQPATISNWYNLGDLTYPIIKCKFFPF